jgi:hypothetical protein
MCQTLARVEMSKESEKIIQNHNVVFLSRKTEYMGGPKITMNQIKGLLSP